jgi:hypothetical protein
MVNTQATDAILVVLLPMLLLCFISFKLQRSKASIVSESGAAMILGRRDTPTQLRVSSTPKQ